MARVVKIDNSIKKRFSRIEVGRSVEKKTQRIFFLIVCEGVKTEPNYFLQLKKSLPVGTLDVQMDIVGTGRNTNSLIDYALKYAQRNSKKFDRIWAVFDRDSFKESSFNDAIQNAKNNQIKVAWSNEAFELWFLLHFQYVNNNMSRSGYQKYLEREISAKLQAPYTYKKNDPNTHKILIAHGNQKQAILWAKKLVQNFTCTRYATHNPCTMVYELIEELENPEMVWKILKK